MSVGHRHGPAAERVLRTLRQINANVEGHESIGKIGLMLIKKRPNRRFREDIPAGLPGFRSWCAGAPRADDDIDGIAVEQPENDAATARSKPGQEVADDRLEFIAYAQKTGHEDGLAHTS